MSRRALLVGGGALAAPALPALLPPGRRARRPVALLVACRPLLVLPAKQVKRQTTVRVFRVFTQMTRRQNFDARPGTDKTVCLMLSIGRHVKLDAHASKFLRARQKF